MRTLLYSFKKLGGLLTMFALTKRLLGVPSGFKSGKHSNVGKPGVSGAKLIRKATQGKLAGAGRGY